ncbi:uncharacterized protein LOC133200920 [Saccostrea echinata]|uniref:uncharacterized protein LOC133200920 n=1 Tax=Saccostrea echinata TaxID=191078 RepID=UPI002A7FBE28|nr:uncharacterized protein LOC133200920 [Saccostrea echinata]
MKYVVYENLERNYCAMKTVMKIIYLVLNVLLYPDLILSDCGNYKQFILKTEEGKRLNATFHTANKYGKNTCISHCVRNTACRSVNYCRKLLVCELNFVDADGYPSMLKSDSDFQYYLIDMANTTSKSMSQTPQCLNKYQECFTTHSGARICLPFHDFKEVSSVNVALGKIVYSSTGAGLATSYTRPWFLLDLGQVYEINEIKTYKVHDSVPCVNFDVRIGLTTNVSEMVYCNFGSQIKNVIIVCPRCLVGQFVQLQMTAYNNTRCHFHISKLEVFAHAHIF